MNKFHINHDPSVLDILVSARQYEMSNYPLLGYICSAGLVSQFLSHKRYENPKGLNFKVGMVKPGLILIQSHRYGPEKSNSGDREILVIPKEVFTDNAMVDINFGNPEMIPDVYTSTRISKSLSDLSKVSGRIKKSSNYGPKDIKVAKIELEKRALEGLFIKAVYEQLQKHEIKFIDVISLLRNDITNFIQGLLDENEPDKSMNSSKINKSIQKWRSKGKVASI